MWWLFLEIWVWLLGAFVLGWAAHWFLCCRGESETLDDTKQTGSALAATQTEPAIAISDDWKPMTFANAPDSVDDLKRIKGIGAVIEKTLNELGIYQFQQIASWNNDNISWVENFLAFPGRLERESWKSQAQTLAEGGTTEFAQRVDKGDVNYSD